MYNNNIAPQKHNIRSSMTSQVRVVMS